MPLVLAENDESLSGHEYDDRTGLWYEFPIRYRRLILPGELFVYYKGRRHPSGRAQKQVYFGSGVVGSVSEPNNLDLMMCGIVDYAPFGVPVYFKGMDGKYREHRANSIHNHFRNGVRSISTADFTAIVHAGSHH